jgi:hypothetical protein
MKGRWRREEKEANNIGLIYSCLPIVDTMSEGIKVPPEGTGGTRVQEMAMPAGAMGPQRGDLLHGRGPRYMLTTKSG